MAQGPSALSAAEQGFGTAPIPRTSLATRGKVPGEVTLEFQKWYSDGQTAWQRGQHAGFSRAAAQRLVANGVARVISIEEDALVVPQRANIVTK